MPNNANSRRKGSALPSAKVSSNKLVRGQVLTAQIADVSSSPSSASEATSHTTPPSGTAGGDLTGTFPNPTLAAVGGGAIGPLGSSTRVPVVTRDAKGRVTALTDAAIAFPSGYVPTGGSAYATLKKNSATNYDTGWYGPYVFNLQEMGGDPTGANPTATFNAINAIVNAVNAKGGYAVIYIPTGNFVYNGQPNQFTTVTNVTIYGDGWASVLKSNVTGAAGNTFVFDSACSFITIENLAMLGSASVRGSGIHIRMYAANDAVIRNCYVQGCSDFGIHLSNTSSSAYSVRYTVEGCHITGTLGDGIHVGNCTDVDIVGNVIDNTGDDAIGLVADNTGYGPQRVNVVGNEIYNSGSRGVSLLECTDCLVEGNLIHTTLQSGVEVTRYLSTSFYNTRCVIKGNRFYNCTTLIGAIGNINLYWATDCAVIDNEIYAPSNGANIAYLDIQTSVIAGNICEAGKNYGIRGYTYGASNVATNWTGNTFKNNVIVSTVNGDGILITADSGKTLVNTLVTGNDQIGSASGVFITYQQMTTAKICNNTAVSGSYGSGGTNSGVTLVNNN